jgi:hypothetical protein
LNGKTEPLRSTVKTRKDRWYIKGWIYWITFLLLYFAYKFIPFAPLKLICAINESNFQHYKAAFFSWIIVSTGEYLWISRKIEDRRGFFYSRITTATILPWFVFVMWYTGIAVFGRLPSIPLEIFYANIITIVVGIFAAIFEQGISRVAYTRELKTIILILFFSSLLLFVVFTFGELPWADVFIEPDWK